MRASPVALGLTLVALGAVLLLAPGCGGLGLGQYSDAAQLADTSGADADSGPTHGNAGNGADSSGDPPVSVGLAGHTWAVDLKDVTFAEPPGMAMVTSLMTSTILLFHATAETSGTLDLVVALAAPDGTQDACQPVQQLPTAEWLNPTFDLNKGELDITISHQTVAFQHALLDATIGADGQTWSNGELSGRIDGRQLSAALNGTDVCALVQSMGGACSPCDDGVVQCFDLDIQDIGGVSAGAFADPPSGC